MNKVMYTCDLCGARTTDQFLFKKLPVLVLCHLKLGFGDDDHVSHRYSQCNRLLCPDCQDKLAFFETSALQGNVWRGRITVREERLPSEWVRIPDSEKADWGIVEVD